MVRTEIIYNGKLQCEARHLDSGAALLTDAPRDNHGQGSSFSPTDLVGVALGSCMLTVMGIRARALGVDLSDARVAVDKQMVQGPPRRIGTLAVRFHLPAAIAAEHRAALEHAARTCPVHQSLHPDVQVPVAFDWSR